MRSNSISVNKSLEAYFSSTSLTTSQYVVNVASFLTSTRLLRRHYNLSPYRGRDSLLHKELKEPHVHSQECWSCRKPPRVRTWKQWIKSYGMCRKCWSSAENGCSLHIFDTIGHLLVVLARSIYQVVGAEVQGSPVAFVPGRVTLGAATLMKSSFDRLFGILFPLN